MDLKVRSGEWLFRATFETVRAWRNGIRTGLSENLSARRETGDAELLKVGETSHQWQSRAKPGEKSAGKV